MEVEAGLDGVRFMSVVTVCDTAISPVVIPEAEPISTKLRSEGTGRIQQKKFGEMF